MWLIHINHLRTEEGNTNTGFWLALLVTPRPCLLPGCPKGYREEQVSPLQEVTEVLGVGTLKHTANSTQASPKAHREQPWQKDLPQLITAQTTSSPQGAHGTKIQRRALLNTHESWHRSTIVPLHPAGPFQGQGATAAASLHCSSSRLEEHPFGMCLTPREPSPSFPCQLQMRH